MINSILYSFDSLEQEKKSGARTMSMARRQMSHQELSVGAGVVLIGFHVLDYKQTRTGSGVRHQCRRHNPIRL